MSTETEFEKEQYEKRAVSLSVVATEYFGDKQPLFMRSVRVDGTADDHEVEVAINELGYGIIVRIDKRTFVIAERDLIVAALDYLEEI